MQLDLPLIQAPRAPHPEPPGTQHSAPSTEHPAPGTRHPEPITRHLTPVEFVRHPKARRYVIRVRDDGSVRVTIPRGGSKREAQEFAARQQRWIEKQRARAAAEPSTPQDPVSPEEVRVLRARAAGELPPRLLELAALHGLRVSRVSVRNQRWRWGSCSRGAHICLNWRLVAMPPEIRDYVMIHELMHLKRMDHSPRFWKLVAAACPEYQSARRWLRDHALVRLDTIQPCRSSTAPP